MDDTFHHVSCILWSCMNLEILKIPCNYYTYSQNAPVLLMNCYAIDSEGFYLNTTVERSNHGFECAKGKLIRKVTSFTLIYIYFTLYHTYFQNRPVISTQPLAFFGLIPVCSPCCSV